MADLSVYTNHRMEVCIITTEYMTNCPGKTKKQEKNVVFDFIWYNANFVQCRCFWSKKSFLASLPFRSLLAVGGLVLSPVIVCPSVV